MGVAVIIRQTDRHTHANELPDEHLLKHRPRFARSISLFLSIVSVANIGSVCA